MKTFRGEIESLELELARMDGRISVAADRTKAAQAAFDELPVEDVQAGHHRDKAVSISQLQEEIHHLHRVNLFYKKYLKSCRDVFVYSYPSDKTQSFPIWLGDD